MSESRKDNEAVELGVDDLKSRDKMLEGSMWMTAGSILSRILGAIYIIPWRHWLGADYLPANALYVEGYNVYALLLIVAIAGIPSAIAKQVAHYNAMNEYGVGVKLYKRGLLLSATTGVICALFLYFLSPFLSNGDQQVVPVMRTLALAVLLIPTVSITRGFFQGYQDMAPSAISQFMEQVFRVFYMLLMTFLIMRVWHGDWISTVSQSTLAAFIGSLAALISLGFYYFKRRKYYQRLVDNSNNQVHVNTTQLYKEIFQQALPFIVLGAGIQIFSLIDQFTFFDLMKIFRGYPYLIVQKLYAIFAGNANKLVMISVSLSSSLAIAVVPMLSEAYTHNDNHQIKNQITNGLILCEFVMFPASLGISAVAGPLNRVFYGIGQQALSANVLSFYSLVGISLGLFTVLSAMMQGISQNKLAVKYFVIGTIAKIVTQVPAIYFFGTFGPLISTGIGFMLANMLIMNSMKQQFNISYHGLMAKTNQILLFSLLTYVVALISVKVLNFGLGHFINVQSGLISLLVTAVAALMGGLIYVYLVLKSRLADSVMGERVARFRKVLHIK